jgi:Ni/Co efflux regulator RcnB
MALAQQNDDHHDDHQQNQYVQHKDWKRGYHMNHDDWDRGQRVDDWHTHHLTAPRDGYEWRQIDGNYVMADRNGVVSTVVVQRDRR